jgi:hypothetical protein
MPKWGKTCNFPCISSQSGVRFERAPSPSRIIPSHPRLAWVSAFPKPCARSVLSVLISGKGFCFSDHVRSPDLLCVPSCPLWLKVLGSPISRDVGACWSFHFRRFLAIMAILAISGGPHPLFFDFRCKQSTYSIRRLGLPCATLGWPLGHPWVTQGSPNPNPNLQRVANLFKYQIPVLSLDQQLEASVVKDHGSRAHFNLGPNIVFYHLFAH